MGHKLTIWKAAQLAGVSRGVLQDHVRKGDLVLSDGLVDSDNLLNLYPDLSLEKTGLLERVTSIRDDAFGKRVRERVLPSQDVLARRLFQQTQELADTKRLLQRYHSLVLDFQKRIQALDHETVGNGQLAEVQEALRIGLARTLATEQADPLTVMDDMLKVMSAEITVRPSGRQFSVEGQDTLLQAGLKAGLKLNYGCGNGTCGMCKVRVINGDVARVQHSDYVFSEVERAQGYALMCANTAASSEMTLELLEARGPSDIPEQQIVTNVRAVRKINATTSLLHLQTPRSHRLRFLAGQSATLGVTLGNGNQLTGSFPIASCPCDDRNLHFFVENQSDDSFSEYVTGEEFTANQQVTLWGPFGDFVLKESERHLVFAAAGLGFSPVKSLIEHALALDNSPSLTLLWLAQNSEGHFLENQCRAWDAALDQFEYTCLTNPSWSEGAVELARTIQTDLFALDCDYYLAGPQEFVDALASRLISFGVSEAQIITTHILSPDVLHR